MPVNHFDTPEAIGETGRAKLDIGYVGANEVVLTNNYLVTAPSISHPEAINRGDYVRLGGGIGVIDSLDVELKSLSAIQAKFQFIGEPRKKTKEGNFAVAATVLGGFDYYAASSPSVAGYTVSIKHYDVPVEAGLIAGYRIWDPLLVYVGGYGRYVSTWGTHKPSSSSVETQYSGNVTGYGGNFGVEFGYAGFQISGEVGYGKVKAGDRSDNQLAFGAQLALNFGGQN